MVSLLAFLRKTVMKAIPRMFKSDAFLNFCDVCKASCEIMMFYVDLVKDFAAVVLFDHMSSNILVSKIHLLFFRLIWNSLSSLFQMNQFEGINGLNLNICKYFLMVSSGLSQVWFMNCEFQYFSDFSYFFSYWSLFTTFFSTNICQSQRPKDNQLS